MNHTIGIQGIKGAFHEEAAIKIFGNNIEIEPCISFKEMVEKINTGAIVWGMMAIENSISGTISENLELIRKYKLTISGETYLRIKQNMGVLKGAGFETIKEVHSHYMALNQCRDFFDNYPHIHLVESADTALSIKYVAESGDNTIAAIGSKLAIEYYGLEMLAESIETNKENYTRFVVISKNPVIHEGYDKMSLTFRLAHQTGALSKILNVLHGFEANLTKIESVPIVGHPWEYRFYIDFIVSPAANKEEMMGLLDEYTNELTVLGRYISTTDDAL